MSCIEHKLTCKYTNRRNRAGRAGGRFPISTLYMYFDMTLIFLVPTIPLALFIWGVPRTQPLTFYFKIHLTTIDSEENA
jgi:hypothetical protein